MNSMDRLNSAIQNNKRCFHLKVASFSRHLQLGLTSMGRLVYIDKTDIYYISVTELDQNSLIKFIGSLRTFCLVKLSKWLEKVLQDRTFLVNR